MSIVALFPGKSIQNAVYIALGVSIGAWYFSLTNFSLFETDLKAAIAGILFIASLIAALLFYIKPERIALRLYRWWVYISNRSTILRFIIVSRIKLEIWRLAVIEGWETPEEEAKFSIRDATTSPDLFEDIWSLIGAFYFVVGIPFLVLSLRLDSPLSSMLIIMLIGIILISLVLNQWNLPERIYKVALFRGFQEAYSRANKLPTRTISGELLDELDNMIRNRTWLRFERRFQYVINEFKIKEPESLKELESYYFNSAILYSISDTIETRNQVASLILVIRDVLSSDIDISQSNLPPILDEALDLAAKSCLLTKKIFDLKIESEYFEKLIDLLLDCQEVKPSATEIQWIRRILTLLVEMEDENRIDSVRKIVTLLGSFGENEEISKIVEDIIDTYNLDRKWSGAPKNVLSLLGKISRSSRSNTVVERAKEALLINIHNSPAVVLNQIDISESRTLAKIVDLVYASDDDISKALVDAVKRAFDTNAERFIESIMLLYTGSDANLRHSVIVLLGMIANHFQKYKNFALRLLEKSILDTEGGNAVQAATELAFTGDEWSLKYLINLEAGEVDTYTANVIKHTIDELKKLLHRKQKSKKA